MPVLCLTIDNGPWLPSLHRGSRCFVVVASSWRYVRADEDLRSVLPRSTLQLSPQLCVLIQVRTQTEGHGHGPVFPRCARVVRMEGRGCGLPEGLDNSRGRRRPAAAWLLTSCGVDEGVGGGAA